MLNYGGYGLGLLFTAKDLATTAMRNVEMGLRSVSDTADAASRRFGQALTYMKTGLLGLTVGSGIVLTFAKIGKAAFNTATQFEEVTTAFERFMGSRALAEAHVAELQRFAERTPFQFMELTGYSRQLQAFGFQAERVIPILTAAGDAAAALNDPQALGTLIEALGKTQAKGRLMARELISIAAAGIPVYKLLEEELGLTKEQLIRIGETGVDSGKAIDAIMTGLTKRYGGMMAAFMKTPRGIISNIEDYMTRLRRGIGEQFYDEVVRALRNVLRTVQALGAEGFMKGVGEGFRGIVTVATSLLSVVLALVRGVADFLAARPWLTSFVVTFVGIGGAVMIVVGGILILKGVLMGLPILMARLGLAGKVSLGMLAWPVLAVTAAVVGLRMAFERNLGGIATLWRGVATLIAGTKFDPQLGWVSALPEALRNELARLNLLPLAVKIWMVFVRIRAFSLGFLVGMRSFVREVGRALAPIGEAFMAVARAVVEPILGASMRATSAAAGLPIERFTDFGLAVARAFERVLPYVRGFGLGLAWAMRVVAAVVRPIVSVIVAGVQLLARVLTWVAGRLGMVGRSADGVSTLARAVGALVGVLLALKAAAAMKLLFVGGIQTALGPLRAAASLLTGLPATIGRVGIFFGNLAARMSMFNPAKLVAPFVRISGALKGVRSYLANLREMTRFAAEGIEGFGRSLVRNSVRVVQFGATLVRTATKQAGQFIGGLVRMGGTLMRNFLPAVGRAIAAAWQFAAAILANPVTWIVAAVVGLGVALYFLIRNWDRVTAALGRAWAKIRAFAKGLSPRSLGLLTAFLPILGIPLLIIRNWDTIRAFFGRLWSGIVAGASGFAAWVRGIPGWFAGLPGQIGGWLSDIWGRIVGFFRSLLPDSAKEAGQFIAWLQAVPEWFAGLPGAIMERLSGLWDSVVGFFQSLRESSASAAGGFVNWLQGMPEWFAGLPERIGAQLSGAGGRLAELLRPLWEGVAAGAEGFASWARGIPDWFAGLPERVAAGLSGMRNTIIEHFGTLVPALTTAAQGFASWVQGIPTWFTGLPGRVSAGLSGMRDTIVQYFSTILPTLTPVAQGFSTWVEGIPGWFSKLPGQIQTYLTQISNAIVQLFTSLPARAVEWGRNLINSFIEGIKSSPIVETVSNIAGALKKYLGFGSPTEAGPGATADLWAPNFVAMFTEGLRRGIPLITAATVEAAAAIAGAFGGVPEMLPQPAMVSPYQQSIATPVPMRQPERPAVAPIVPPVVVQPPAPAQTPGREQPSGRPLVVQLVVDGRVLAEVVRRIDAEDRARSATW